MVSVWAGGRAPPTQSAPKPRPTIVSPPAGRRQPPGQRRPPKRARTNPILHFRPPPNAPARSLDSGAADAFAHTPAGHLDGQQQRASQQQLDGSAACCPLTGSPSAALVLRADSQRRESFLYRASENDYEVSPKSISRHSSIGSEW